MRALFFQCTPSALCVNRLGTNKESTARRVEVRFGVRWNLQNVQGGSVGGYGLLTWFLWISPPPFRSFSFILAWGFCTGSYNDQYVDPSLFWLESSSKDCCSIFGFKLFLPALRPEKMAMKGVLSVEMATLMRDCEAPEDKQHCRDDAKTYFRE